MTTTLLDKLWSMQSKGMTTEDLEGLLNKKVLGVGYDRTHEGYTLVLIFKNKEYYFFSDTPMDFEERDIH